MRLRQGPRGLLLPRSLPFCLPSPSSFLQSFVKPVSFNSAKYRQPGHVGKGTESKDASEGRAQQVDNCCLCWILMSCPLPGNRHKARQSTCSLVLAMFLAGELTRREGQLPSRAHHPCLPGQARLRVAGDPSLRSQPAESGQEGKGVSMTGCCGGFFGPGVTGASASASSPALLPRRFCSIRLLVDGGIQKRRPNPHPCTPLHLLTASSCGALKQEMGGRHFHVGFVQRRASKVGRAEGRPDIRGRDFGHRPRRSLPSPFPVVPACSP